MRRFKKSLLFCLTLLIGLMLSQCFLLPTESGNPTESYSPFPSSPPSEDPLSDSPDSPSEEPQPDSPYPSPSYQPTVYDLVEELCHRGFVCYDEDDNQFDRDLCLEATLNQTQTWQALGVNPIILPTYEYNEWIEISRAIGDRILAMDIDKFTSCFQAVREASCEDVQDVQNIRDLQYHVSPSAQNLSWYVNLYKIFEAEQDCASVLTIQLENF